ncbi:MAG: hypothetical protein V1685_03480 [Parcubacteria group bacterium]
MEELDLKKYLGIYKDRKVDFFRFPGNYGDSLIWHGTKMLLSSLNIAEHYVDGDSPTYNPVVMIDGSGNFVDYYSDVKNFLLKQAKQYEKIVILPHTIFGEKQVEVLNALSSKLVIFVVKKFQHNFLKND